MVKTVSDAADLALVADYFTGQGLTAQRFPGKDTRSKIKRPDFRLLRGSELVAYCEVKSAIDGWLSSKLVGAAPGEVRGGECTQAGYNRIGRNIEHAAGQFDEVNPSRLVPNILFFVNHDAGVDWRDLVAALTGIYPLDRETYTLNPKAMQASDGKIRIDLFVWLDVEDVKPFYHFSLVDDSHVKALCSLLSIDQSGIKLVHRNCRPLSN